MTLPPTGYSAERELQEALLNYCMTGWDLPQVPGGSVLMRREVPVAGIVPDLVYIRVPPIPHKPVRSWSWRHAHVVTQLRARQSLRVPTLASKIFESVSKTADLVGDLEAARVAERTGRGAVRLTGEFRAFVPFITAFEAKLTRWSEAMTQAHSYRVFADEVIVVMNSPRAASDMAIRARFRSEGIGLWLVASGETTQIVQPRREPSSGPARDWLVGRISQRSAQTRWVAR